MTITELIEKLTEVRAKDGDLQVVLYRDANGDMVTRFEVEAVEAFSNKNRDWFQEIPSFVNQVGDVRVVVIR